jgi:hypothetical protein
MPTSARLFVYEGLRETTRTTTRKKKRKQRNSHHFPPRREKKKNKQTGFHQCYDLFKSFFFFRFRSGTSSHAKFVALFFYSVYLVLGSVHRLRPASSLRAHPQIQDDDRRGDFHSKFGATQFGRQSAHLLPILHAPLPQSQVKHLRTFPLFKPFKILWYSPTTGKKKENSNKSWVGKCWHPGDDVGDE